MSPNTLAILYESPDTISASEWPSKELMHSSIERNYISEFGSRWDFVASLTPVVRMPCVDLAVRDSLKKNVYLCQRAQGTDGFPRDG